MKTEEADFLPLHRRFDHLVYSRERQDALLVIDGHAIYLAKRELTALQQQIWAALRDMDKAHEVEEQKEMTF